MLTSQKNNTLKNKVIPSTKRKGQVAIEFLLLIGLSFFVIMTFVIVAAMIGEDNTKRQSYEDLYEYGKYLQKEFSLASELEDGYVRKLNVPETINGLIFNLTLGQHQNISYFTISYESAEFYYQIPQTQGIIGKGKNYLRKENNTLYMN